MTSKVQIASQACVCRDTLITGHVIIEAGAVVHPKAKILAENSGGLVLGKDTVVEEGVTLCNSQPATMVIGYGCHFQCESVVENTNVGNQVTVETRAAIRSAGKVGNGCIVGIQCVVEQSLPEQTIVYGTNHLQRPRFDSLEASSLLHQQHLKYLREIVPRYNHLRQE